MSSLDEALWTHLAEWSPITIHLYVDDFDAVVESAVQCGAKVTMQVPLR